MSRTTLRHSTAAVGLFGALAVGGTLAPAALATTHHTVAAGRTAVATSTASTASTPTVVASGSTSTSSSHSGRAGLAGLTGLVGLFGYRKYKAVRAPRRTVRPGDLGDGDGLRRQT